VSLSSLEAVQSYFFIFFFFFFFHRNGHQIQSIRTPNTYIIIIIIIIIIFVDVLYTPAGCSHNIILYYSALHYRRVHAARRYIILLFLLLLLVLLRFVPLRSNRVFKEVIIFQNHDTVWKMFRWQSVIRFESSRCVRYTKNTYSVQLDFSGHGKFKRKQSFGDRGRRDDWRSGGGAGGLLPGAFAVAFATLTMNGSPKKRPTPTAFDLNASRELSAN